MSFFKRYRSYFLSLAFTMLCMPSFAEKPGLLVSPAWLAEHIDEPNVVVIHIGKEKDFLQGHIPGAQRLDTVVDLAHPNSQTYSADSLFLELPDIAQLEKTLESVGISNDSTIVLYWPGDAITNATRALFTLDWAGLGQQSHLLNGGLEAWKRAKQEIVSEPAPAKTGELTLTLNDDRVVDADWVKTHGKHPGVGLIDARPKAFYDGISSYQNIKGHIGGAGSAPWTAFIDKDLKLHDPDTLQNLLTNAGVQPGDIVVAYCHIGQFATMAMLAARTLGYEVRLYDGAFQDWAHKGLPPSTELPSKKGQE